MKKYFLIFLMSLFVLPTTLLAKGGSGFSFFAIGGFNTANQDDMNTLIKDAVSDVSATTAQLENAYEVGVGVQYRFPTYLSVSLRPLFFFESSSGAASGTDYNYSMVGYNIGLIFKFYPLESDMFKMYFNTGIVYGNLGGTVKEDDHSVKFNGSGLGYQLGLGTEICFAKIHCVTMEGNYRILPINRSTVNSLSGSARAGTVITQDGAGKEFEINGTDFASTMTGVQAIVGYSYSLK